MKTRRKPGPPPYKVADKRIPWVVTLSPNEYGKLAKVRGDVPFSTWARGVLLRSLTEDPSPISQLRVAKRKGPM